MKSVVIVGGGSAGWLTALYVNKFWKDTSVSVIASSKMGILGAGESTTPNFSAILRGLEIDEIDFIKNTNATIKIGNNFINWRGDGKNVVHTFMGESTPNNPIHGFHFDARLVAEYFKKIAISRGITYIDSEIVGFNQTDNGDVNYIHLVDNSSVYSDFIFDCSGFARLLIGKLYKGQWKSYREYLKIDTAIAYFLPQLDNIKYNSKVPTKSIAMKSGWMWQAPLQHRWGCGYAFDSNYISENEAKIEVEEYVGNSIDIVKTFKFNTGCYEDVWISNCIAIGLAASFLEPLEATSLLSTIMMLKRLKEVDFDLNYKDKFNDFVRSINEQNMLFIRYQYMCDRIDTEFWRNQKNVSIPTKLANMLDINNDLLVKTNEDISDVLGITNTDMKLIFGYDNYNTIFKKNSNKFSKILI